jgi:hypothetical protein
MKIEIISTKFTKNNNLIQEIRTMTSDKSGKKKKKSVFKIHSVELCP